MIKTFGESASAMDRSRIAFALLENQWIKAKSTLAEAGFMSSVTEAVSALTAGLKSEAMQASLKSFGHKRKKPPPPS